MKHALRKLSGILIVLHLLIATAFAVDTVTFYHTDPAGTPLALTNSTGAIARKADYKPFGEELITAAVKDNYKMFVGKEKEL